MSGLSRTRARMRNYAGFLVIALVVACQRERAARRDPYTNAAPSGSALDGMQMSSARRVALESATAAMQRRDLERLKQLSVWVRNRGQSPIFEPDDLQALDLAIQCLEQVAPPPDAVTTLDQIESGTLKKPARDVCATAAAK